MKLINEVFIGSFTGKTEKEQKNILEEFRDKNIHDKLKISISPNLVNKELIKMLKQYNVDTVELEVQTTSRIYIKKVPDIHMS